jgi:hypothetical protein
MSVNRRKEEEGIVLVIVAVFLVALVGALALAVDIGALYSARTSAQRVADAAALAGAFTFALDPSAVQPDTAINYAQKVATNSSLLGKPIALADVTVTADVTTYKVKVDITSTQNTFFARAFNITSADIAVEAIAEAVDPTGKKGPKIVPWFIPNTVLSGDCSACKPPAGGTNPPHTLVDGTPSQITDWAKSQLPVLIDPLKPNNPNGAIAPGDFYSIRMPNDSSSGNLYRDNISGRDLNDAVSCGESYPLLTGNKVGPTNQGVDALVGDPPTDKWGGVVNGVPQYITPTGTSDISDALVRVPIWDSCGATFCPGNNFPKDVTDLTIVGFAWMFIDGHTGSGVKAHLVGVAGCGSTGGAGAPFTPAPWLPPRLVHE